MSHDIASLKDQLQQWLKALLFVTVARWMGAMLFPDRENRQSK